MTTTTSPLLTIGAPPVKEDTDALIAEINDLRKKQGAVIMAHNYQIPEIQDLADYVGDSLGLARQAAKANAKVIVLCGVYFMAETAKLLNPTSTVVIPDAGAGCSLADSITADQLREWKAMYPNAVVVSYVNTSAAVKAETDICCTSGNAEAVIRSIPPDRPILFGPDMFLGDYLRRVTGREMHIWAGECHVHAAIRPSAINAQLLAQPDADLLVHPECGCSSAVVWARAKGALLPDRTYLLS
ncbi:MAG: quinolinate synthase NadA, partial [Dehalococcoidia bacterium]|nr:quinolinate synthase NadA [Dehalococcoidia bacterium]